MKPIITHTSIINKLKIKDYPELFASLRELGYEPFFSNGHIEIEIKEKKQ